jgi:hypothetical protein
MTRKAILERASVLNAASLQASAAFAVVATNEEVRPEAVTATFKCGGCSTIFASNAGATPFCVTCGSHHVTASSDLVPASLPADDDLSAYVCASCGIYNVLSSANVPNLKSHGHCVACGTVHNFVEQTAEMGDDGAGDGMQGQQQQDQGSQQMDSAAPMTPMAPAAGDKPMTADQGDQTDQSDPQGDPGMQQQAAGGKPWEKGQDDDQQQEQKAAGDQKVDDGMQGQQQQEQMKATDTGSVPLDDDEILQDQAPQAADEQQMAQDPAVASVKVSLLATALASNPKAALALHHTGDSILAMIDGLHVATLTPDAKPEYAGLFEKAPFSQSILHVAHDKGIVAALDDYGFKKTSVSVPMVAAAKALIARGVAAKTKELTATTASVSADLKQSLSIAASALNKGFWKSKSNPLKTALTAALQNAGIANPNRILTNVFASSGDAYVKTLLEAALELSGKSVEFRNELSASLSDQQYLADAQGEQDDEDEDGEFTGAAFEAPATAITAGMNHSQPQVARHRDSQQSSVHATVARVGGSLFLR